MEFMSAAYNTTIPCGECGAVRHIKPSDAFQVERCKPCQRKHRQAIRNAQARAKRPAKRATRAAQATATPFELAMGA